jgi:integrase
MKNSNYTIPVIKRYSNDDWCVEYSYRYPENWPEYPAMKRFKVRDGVNYHKDAEAKENALNELRETIHVALKDLAFDPFAMFIQKEKEYQEQLSQAEAIKAKLASPRLSIGDALTWFISAKTKFGLSSRTIAGYKSYLKNLKLWIDEYNSKSGEVTYNYIDQVSAAVIEEYLDSKSNWRARTYNNNLKGLITTFTYLHKKKKIEINPLINLAIEIRPSRAEKNKYYSKALRLYIQPELDKKPYLDCFIKWIYYSCGRISELQGLKVGNIDCDLKKIIVPAEIGKTGAYVGNRTIPICEELFEIIQEMRITSYPNEYYLFSKDRRPGPNPVPDDYFRDLYLPIKRQLDLDKNYTMYSFKHTRVVDLLAAGYSSQLVMFLTGHTDWASFQKYCRELGVVLDGQLTGKTISY